MNKFLNFFNKFEVSPFASIFIFLTLLTNSYKLFFIYFLITFIHELGHVLMATIFKLKINKIKLLAIGFNAEIDNLDYTDSFKELLIVIAGPLTYFISLPLLNYMYKIDFISYNAYIQSLTINKYTFFFNLLPIYPLDGGRIVKIILNNFFTIKRTLIISNYISCVTLVLFFIFTINQPQWLIYSFLIINNVISYITINKKWKLFLINRLTFNNKYKKKIHSKKDIYRNKNNYIITNKRIVNEREIIIKLLKN